MSDEDTAELPVLNPATFAGSAHSPPGATNGSSDNRAERWVRHVEGEVDRLQKRWESLDKELTAAKDHSAEQRAQIEQRDATISGLHAELETTHQEIDCLAATIVEREKTIKSLGLTASERDDELAAVSRSLNEANARLEVLGDRLKTAEQQVDELRNCVLDEKSRAAELRAEKETVSASNASLRSRLQELESYIEGRRDKWSEQQATLNSLNAKISSLETALAGSERLVAERDSSIATLELRIRELEREVGEVEGRHNEREAAHREAQTLLQERIAEVEQLKTKIEQRTAGADNAIEEASSHREQLEVLRASLTEKDEAIHRLETNLGKLEAVGDHIEDQQRVDRQTIGQLQNEVAQLQSNGDTLTDALAEARTKMLSLSHELEETELARSETQKENEAQKRRITILEAALDARTEIIAGFDANAQRLNELGRNLNALGDIGLDDERVPIVTDDHQNQEMLEAEVLLDPYDIDEHVDTALGIPGHEFEHEHDADNDSVLARLSAGDDADQAQRRAMIELRGHNGDRPIHVISTPIMTIGRAKSSDIRINDIVVSRTHARLRLDEEGVVIEDASSKNGLAVNEKVVDRAVLKHGDVVSLGNGHAYRYVELELPTRTH